MLTMLTKCIKQIQQYSIVHLLYIITFITSGIVLNVIQATLYFTLRYFNKRLYRQINYYLMYSFQCHLVFIPTWWSGSRINLYIDKDDYKNYCGKEHVLLLGNHSYEIDWLMGWQLGDTLGVLGNCKAFIKKSIQYIPALGWTWKFGEYIFLDRSFEKDKVNIPRQISELGDFPDPVWLLLFAEGTRITPAKLKNSQEFAKERGLPLLQHHLLPRTKGFVLSLQGMKNKINVLYDCQIGFTKNAEVAPTIWNLILGKPVEAHLYISRIKADDLPKDEEALTKWLYAHYEKKDKLQDSLYNTGSFFTNSGVKSIEPITVTRRIWPLINAIFWNTIVLVPLLRFFTVWTFSGGLFNIFISSIIIILLHFITKQMIGLLEMKKGSKYGATKNK